MAIIRLDSNNNNSELIMARLLGLLTPTTHPNCSCWQKNMFIVKRFVLPDMKEIYVNQWYIDIFINILISFINKGSYILTGV